ncbi:hypothetical protein BaRGS_00000859 [Batillaria attramentaria]|uniref:Uncharacterized protein n=1 Tax=Batillaria attramentaria TaxID=370345 RepID=A0ABD0M8Y4_9CAEN
MNDRRKSSRLGWAVRSIDSFVCAPEGKKLVVCIGCGMLRNLRPERERQTTHRAGVALGGVECVDASSRLAEPPHRPVCILYALTSNTVIPSKQGTTTIPKCYYQRKMLIGFQSVLCLHCF